MASRRQKDWPPAVEGFDILVNATPVKDELIVAPHPGMEVVDLAYRPDGSDTALVADARAAGCEVVVDGLDVLLCQGTAAFERWTGLTAPVAAMREALRGPRRGIEGDAHRRDRGGVHLDE
jgi:shikimate dehydrogenase